MPNRDGTGPAGKGPMTGGCRGFCAVPDDLKKKTLEELHNEGYAGYGFFGRFGCGCGFGRGLRRRRRRRGGWGW